MKKFEAARGSALMIALVIVIITAGVGGAFLSQALFHSNEQRWSIEGDEAFSMCDAGIERARHALGLYKGAKTSTWTWDQIITYCATSSAAKTSKYATPGKLRTQDMKAGIKSDALALFKSTSFSSYLSTINASGMGSAIVNDTLDPMALIPFNKALWTSPDAGKVLFGNSIPFNRGALYIDIAYPLNADGSVPAAGTSPDNLIVTVTATLQSGIQRQVEAVIQKATSSITVPGLAAVVSNDEVSLTGSIIVDGRDHDYAGANVLAAGDPNRHDVFGIVSNSAMSDPTNGAVGGNGNAPPRPKGSAANSVKSLYNFPNGYPTTPDGAMSDATGASLPSGTLKQAAQDSGSYFNSQSAYTSWLSANNGKMPDGAIIYLEFTPGNGQFNLGSGNSKSSILILHTDTMSGIAQEVHGNFTGLLMADGFVRNNGTSHITGMVQLFSPTASTAGNVFGNGNAEIDFSSAALADLPGLGGSGNPAKLISYRRIQ